MEITTTANWTDIFLQKRWLRHASFWVLFVLLFSIFAGLNSGYFFTETIKYIAMLPAYWFATYSLVYVLSPRFLLQKKYGQFALFFILSAYVSCILARWGVIYLAEPFFRTDFRQESLFEIITDPIYLLFVYFPAVYIIAIIFFLIKTIKDRFAEKHQIEILKKEKATNELRFLKAQIHPHFLFNTLNNLYSLTQEQSPKAPEVVLKLSEILDYMLYQSEAMQVPLERELQLVQNYLDLESLRYGEKLAIQFDKNITATDAKIAPLVLLSLVENAFKHGVSKRLQGAWVNIVVSNSGADLAIKVSNSQPLKSVAASPNHKGIGTPNIQRQLDLIYPKRHQLTVHETADAYTVHLTIFNV